MGGEVNALYLHNLLITHCISTISYVINMNGRMGETFKPTKGLRLGDPLNLFLFIICSEGLSALMSLTVSEGHLTGVRASKNGPPISHLLFVDDCNLFSKAN